jgi:hypothetical protein
MIDEAIGKILGMAMAYGASALGMFVAYVNYRKRIVKADKVMSPAAWGVIALSALAVLVAVFIVFQIAGEPVEAPPPDVVEVAEPAAEPTAPVTPAEIDESRSRWPLVGMVVPALIFLFATWITAGLHRHFTTHGH